MSGTSSIGAGFGKALAQRLGLRIEKQEGHDLGGPCITCKSSDAFRIHRDTGVGYCYSCGAKWSPLQVAETVLGDRRAASSLLVELGLLPSSAHNGNAHQPDPVDAIGVIAKTKGVTRAAFVAFGATPATPTSIKLPAYGADGQQCTEFTMSIAGDKGKFAKGKPAGLFFPHVDGRVRHPAGGETWHVVEGPKDAAALYDLGLMACGLNTCRLAKKFGRLFRDVHVVLVPDRDRAGEQGAEHSGRVLRGIAASIRVAVLPAEFRDSGGDDVRDVLRQPNGKELVLQAIADATMWEPKPAPEMILRELPEIEITPEEIRVNDQAVDALVRDETLFQRGGALVHILHDHGARTLKGITRPANSPRIAPLRDASLRERLTKVARFMKRIETKEGEELVPVHPPAFCVSAVAARCHWRSVRHLEGVISSPILRQDGTVLQTPGYDEETGLFYEPDGAPISVPESPTRDDACAGRELLLEVVSEFPFAKPAHRAAWLALTLTPLARHAFVGPSPLFLVDANVRGSGKSLLADAAALIVTGRTMARMSYPGDDDETRKRITALALGGDQLVLIDNIIGELGSAALDAALTGTVWKDRILGKSEIVEMPLVTTWAATGNNVVLLADTSRRVCHIRLDSKLENPEEREGFRHPDLLRWVREYRPQLLSAALTILSAYCGAGRPDQKLKAWGSFEGWSGLVRQALVWIGLPDPGETRQELARSSDREAAALRALIQGWPDVDPENNGLTTAKLIDCLEKRPGDHELVRAAVLELCPAPFGKMPGTRSLGNKLRHLRGRVVGGKALEKREPHGTAVWYVAQVGQAGEAPSESSGCSGGSGCSVSGYGPSGFSADDTAGNRPTASGDERESEQPEQPEQPGTSMENQGGADASAGWEEGEL